MSDKEVQSHAAKGSSVAGVFGGAAGAVVDKVKGNKEIEEMEKGAKEARDRMDNDATRGTATDQQTGGLTQSK